MGLWKPVYVHVTKGISIHYPAVVTSYLAEDYSEADLDVMVEVSNPRNYSISGTILVSLPTISDQVISKKVTMDSNSEEKIWLNHTEY